MNNMTKKVSMLIIIILLILFSVFILLSYFGPSKEGPATLKIKEIEFNYPRRGHDREY